MKPKSHFEPVVLRTYQSRLLRGSQIDSLKARDPGLDRAVALKVLHMAYTERSDVVQRFLVEVRRVAVSAAARAGGCASSQES